jgi:hypothetical protein
LVLFFIMPDDFHLVFVGLNDFLELPHSQLISLFLGVVHCQVSHIHGFSDTGLFDLVDDFLTHQPILLLLPAQVDVLVFGFDQLFLVSSELLIVCL